jgi:hypothetical protein
MLRSCGLPFAGRSSLRFDFDAIFIHPGFSISRKLTIVVAVGGGVVVDRALSRIFVGG